jgi:hypothetical protein
MGGDLDETLKTAIIVHYFCFSSMSTKFQAAYFSLFKIEKKSKKYNQTILWFLAHLT